MLYVTTRIQSERFSASRAMTENRGPEGGFYLPVLAPEFSPRQIEALGEKSFAANVAEIINLLLDTELDSWTVEFAIGRYPVKLKQLSARAMVAETWHNPVWRFERLVCGIEKAIRQSDNIQQTDWMVIAARIAVLFGIFGEMLRENLLSLDNPVDLVVPSGDFSGVMAALYGREWGLPIANIVVCSNENPAAWNLLHKGELRTEGAPIRTATPECDHVVPRDLERLIFHRLGAHETGRFLKICGAGANYYLERYQIDQLREGIHVSVVSGSRMEVTISNLHRNSGYIADPYTALCYSGLLDYRSRTGAARAALVLSEVSPVHHLELTARCLGFGTAELKDRIDRA